MADLSRLISVAQHQAPADCVLAGGRIVNVFNGELETADIAIVDGTIAGVGSGYQGVSRIELGGSFVAPGFIDAHVHIESSLCVPSQFAAALVPRGVTGVIADPHEIANVVGPAGVRYMFDASRDLPLVVTLMAPSCVPATDLATSGGEISDADIRDFRASHLVHGLAEMMNVPGLLAGDPLVLEKLAAMRGRPIDGHGPELRGHRLNAYVAAGVGSDHESVTVDEAREKLARGLFLMIREASNARNLDALLPMVTSSNSRRVCLCTDDRTPVELLSVGSIDEMVRRAVTFGIDPIEAIRMATLNPAEHFGLGHMGAIAPGRLANMMVFDDLATPNARLVFSRGELVAQSGKLLREPRAGDCDAAVTGRCQVDWDRVRWSIPAATDRLRVIGTLPDQLLTEHRVVPARIVAGQAVADVAIDVLKIIVIERHQGTGNSAAGFIQGFGLKRGAIAGTFAHDHHNLVAIGADDLSMQSAARAVAKMGGGMAVAIGEHVVAALALPIAGLMSDRPIAEVAAGYQAVVSAARDLGSRLSDPFMAMSFMTLEVIPALKLTDRGLVDVNAFKFVDLFV
jgi:adenine deaminase